MTRQYSTTLRDYWVNGYKSQIGTAPKLRILTGSPPATPATAQSGTLLVALTLPSDWMGASSSGSATKSGTWSGTIGTSGTAGYYRILNSGETTVHEQGTITQAYSLTTNNSTAANSNTLNFADTSAVTVGQSISGTGVPSGATVLAKTSTTVTMSIASTAGVGNGATIYFGDTSGDLWLASTTLTATQLLTISSWTRTAPGA